MKLQLNEQEKLLCFILQDHICAGEASSKIDETFFKEDFRCLVKFVLKYFNKFRKIPSKHIFQEQIKSSTDKAEKNRYERAWTYFQTYTKDNPIESSDDFSFYLDKVIKEKHADILVDATIKSTQLIRGSQQANGKITDKDTEALQKLFEDSVYYIKGAGSQERIKIINVVENARDFLEQYEVGKNNPQTSKRINFGIKALDTYMGGGLAHALVTIAGRPASGKSALALNMAINVWKQGRGILYISIEMDAKDILNRFYASTSFIREEHLRSYCLTEEEHDILKQKIEIVANNTAPFYIIDFPRNVCMAEIENYFIQHNSIYPIDLVVIDYLGIMKASSSSKRRDDWIELGEISQEMHDFARAFDVVVITASQLTRGKTGKDEFSQDRIARSTRIIDNSDLVIQLADRSNLEHGDQDYQMDACIIKNRWGKNYVEFSMYADLERMYIGDEYADTFYNKKTFDDVAHLEGSNREVKTEKIVKPDTRDVDYLND